MDGFNRNALCMYVELTHFFYQLVLIPFKLKQVLVQCLLIGRTRIIVPLLPCMDIEQCRDLLFCFSPCQLGKQCQSHPDSPEKNRSKHECAGSNSLSEQFVDPW